MSKKDELSGVIRPKKVVKNKAIRINGISSFLAGVCISMKKARKMLKVNAVKKAK